MQRIIDALMARERERCDHIIDQNFTELSNLLSKSLIHTHTRGNTDDKDSYLNYVKDIVEILDVRRENLRVIPMGRNSAVMHGKQINRARLRTQEIGEVEVETMVTQVWALELDGLWRLVAFQATPLGAPPPIVKR